jgi:p-methyltransferase
VSIDAIIISDIGEGSFSGTNPLRLKIDGKTANIQVILNYLQHQGRIVLPIKDNGGASWSSAPKLNGIYLFNYLMRHGFDVELIDTYYEEKEKFCNLLRQTPRVVIISTTFIHNKKALYELVNDIRSLAPDIFIIVGGPFVSLSFQIFQRLRSPRYDLDEVKDDFLFLDNRNEPSIDLYIISLRGERILCDALDRLRNNKPMDDLPNSALFVKNKYIFTRRIDDILNSEAILIDWKSLHDNIFKSGVVPMQASNGCPYKCAFCNFTKDRRVMFLKPIDRLIAELKAVSNRGVRYVWFADDNFRLGSSDLKSVCQRFIDEDIDVYWMSFIRASALKDVDGELLLRSGCIEVQLGLESADPQVLHNMNKKANPTLYSEVIRKLLAAGINCSCYFIFGFPGETDESARRTREFIKSIEHPDLDGIVSFSIFPFTPVPLSPIYEYEMAKKYDLTGYMSNWKHQTMDSYQAMKYVTKAFFELENSGAIYRGDNLDILSSISPRKRKQFVARRHKLSKLAIKRPLEKDDIIGEFGGLFFEELLNRK